MNDACNPIYDASVSSAGLHRSAGLHQEALEVTVELQGAQEASRGQLGFIRKL